jgi:hypothetical protein
MIAMLNPCIFGVIWVIEDHRAASGESADLLLHKGIRALFVSRDQRAITADKANSAGVATLVANKIRTADVGRQSIVQIVGEHHAPPRQSVSRGLRPRAGEAVGLGE